MVGLARVIATVQIPQPPSPQPTCEPVSPLTSRSQSSSVTFGLGLVSKIDSPKRRRRDSCHSAAPHPLPTVGVSIAMERGCQQNDRTLADGVGAPFSQNCIVCFQAGPGAAASTVAAAAGGASVSAAAATTSLWED